MNNLVVIVLRMTDVSVSSRTGHKNLESTLDQKDPKKSSSVMKIKLPLLTFMSMMLFTSTLNAVFSPSKQTPIFGYKILNTYPHDPNAFTQGLLFHDGNLYESCGIYGKSSLRVVELTTGRTQKSISLDQRYFAEGLALRQNELVLLTWREHTGFIYDSLSFTLKKSFNYPAAIREGWGITHDGRKFIMSDGSSKLYFLHNETFALIGHIIVRDQGKQITKLNELEYINGEIFANVWQSDYIARISPDSGQVLSWINLFGLHKRGHLKRSVLNGIAYDRVRHRLFVTGKLWSKLFEIELVRK